MRRATAILASLLVLTFSMSGWSSACEAMSAMTMSQAKHDAGGMSHHQSSSDSHSNNAPGKSGRANDCQHAVWCNGATLAHGVDRETPLTSVTVHVLPPNESRPSS